MTAKPTFICATLFFFMLAQSTNAQDLPECIEDTEKANACEHIIIKKTDPRIARSSRINTQTVCICLSDFQSIIDDIRTQPDQTQQRILEQWQISPRELNQLLRY